MTLAVTPWDGRPISKPGFYSGVPLGQYHSGRLCVGPSLSSSGMRRIVTKSEAHFFDAWPLNPDYDPEANKPNAGMVLGRATHHLLLGQPHFRKEFVREPDTTVDHKGRAQPFSRMYAAARKWVQEQEAAGLTVLSVAQEEAVKGMALRLGHERLVKQGVLNGLREITGAWQDRETGVWCLIRPDVIPTDSGDFTDIKTLGRGIVSYRNLVFAIGEHGYHMQAALCGEGWRILMGQRMASFSFYFIESRRPYCAHMVQLKPEDLALGERQNRNARQRFVKAMNSGQWPGPNGSQEMVAYIDLSDRMRMAMEDELSRQGDREA